MNVRTFALAFSFALLVAGPARAAAAPPTSPDGILSEATVALISGLRQERSQNPAAVTALVESTVLPLFDFPHMTQLAVGAGWRLATPEQQAALTAEFRGLLVRTYASALANYRDQEIRYLPLRLAAEDRDATVRSTVMQPGAQRISIDYDMERTATGWKVFDIKIAGISLITTYRSGFAQTVRDSGIDGLIRMLSAKNRQPA